MVIESSCWIGSQGRSRIGTIPMSLVAACHTGSGSQLTGHVSTHFPGRDDVLSHVDRKGIASQPQSLRRLDSSTPVSRYPLYGPGSLSLAFYFFFHDTAPTE